MNSSLNQFILSIGANLGNRKQTILNAINLLSAYNGINILKISSIYETQPVGYIEQPMFLNLSVLSETKFDCYTILSYCKEIEQLLGRKKRDKWEEREIDIDLILFGDCVINDESLIIPHPRMTERRFVLVPTNEIACDFLHPIDYLSIKSLLENCSDNSLVKLFDNNKTNEAK